MVTLLALGAVTAYIIVLVAFVHAWIDLGSLVASYLMCMLVFVVAVALCLWGGCSVMIGALAGVIAVTCLVPLVMLGERPSKPNAVWYPFID